MVTQSTYEKVMDYYLYVTMWWDWQYIIVSGIFLYFLEKVENILLPNFMLISNISKKSTNIIVIWLLQFQNLP